MIASRSWRGSIFAAALTQFFGAALVTTMTLPGRAQVARHFSLGRSRWSLEGGLRLAAGDARSGRGISKLPPDVDLSSHVGHTITVNGPATPTADGAAADAPRALSVASLKMEAESCTPAAAPAEVPAEAPPADAPAPAEAPAAPPE